MKKIKIGLGTLIVVAITVLTVSVAWALPQLPENRGVNKAKLLSPVIDDNTRHVVAPPTVPVFPQLPEKDLTKIIFIRYAPGFQKDKLCDNDGACEVGEKGWCVDCKGNGEEPSIVCYSFLSGAKPKWNRIENYYYSTSELGTSSAWATAKWDDATSAIIFGDGLSGVYPWGIYDYYNSISFGNYSDPDVIAVTAIWFRGKNIYEYDIMFDTDYFLGSTDLDTVVLHEFGHGAGLNDSYDSVCQGNVMYGYYTGVKTTLGSGDIAGIQALYGQ